MHVLGTSIWGHFGTKKEAPIFSFPRVDMGPQKNRPTFYSVLFGLNRSPFFALILTRFLRWFKQLVFCELRSGQCARNYLSENHHEFPHFG